MTNYVIIGGNYFSIIFKEVFFVVARKYNPSEGKRKGVRCEDLFEYIYTHTEKKNINMH